MSGSRLTRSPWSRKVFFSVAGGLVAILIAGGLAILILELNKQRNLSQSRTAEDSMPQLQGATLNEQGGTGTVHAGAQFNLERLMEVPSHFERAIALDDLLVQSATNDCLRLLDESKKLTEMAFRKWVQVEIFRRLAAIDPKLALVHTDDFPPSQRQRYVQAVFREWAFSHFEAAVDHGETYVKDLSYQENQAILSAILQTRHDLSEDARLQIGNRFGQEHFVTLMSEREEKSALIENPVAGWHKLLEGGAPNLGESNEFLEVALAVVEKKGFDTFVELLLSLPDRSSRTEILSNVLRERIEIEGYQSVFEKALELIEVSNRSVVFGIAEDWARHNVVTVLDEVAKVANVELRKYLREAVAVNWSQGNPQRALDNPLSLPQALQNTADYTALYWLAVRDPPTATNYLDRMSDWESAEFSGSPIPPSIRRGNVLNNLMGNWASRDAKGAYEWLLASSESEESRDSLFGQVLTRVSFANAEGLVDVALQHPSDALGSSSEGEIVAMVATIDISIARKLVGRVRDKSSQLHAHAAIGAELLKQEGDPESSLEYAEELPQSDRSEYFLRLGRRWAFVSPKDAFMHIDRLPSAEAKSSAAFSLTQRNQWTQALSERQVEQLRPLLTEEQLNRLPE